MTMELAMGAGLLLGSWQGWRAAGKVERRRRRHEVRRAIEQECTRWAQAAIEAGEYLQVSGSEELCCCQGPGARFRVYRTPRQRLFLYVENLNGTPTTDPIRALNRQETIAWLLERLPAAEVRVLLEVYFDREVRDG